MENNISAIVRGQLPEHLQESSPLFTEFLVTYYKYASQRNKAVGVIQNNRFDVDIDYTDDAYISEFYDTYGEFLPKEVAIDKRNFVKFLNKIYESKGTEKSLKLLFKLLFNDVVDVFYPTEHILRASDGRWTQENYITVTTKFGILPSGIFSLYISNDTGDYEIQITKILQINSSDFRLYYRSFTKVEFRNDQLVYVYSEDNGETTYIGQLHKSPARIIILKPGAGWQNGQIIIIDGSITPTISRVTSINTTGGVTGIEIVEHGYIHNQNQLITLSPYPNRPSNAGINLITEINENGTYNFILTVTDSTDGTAESVWGESVDYSQSSYFLEDYVELAYSGYVSITQSDIQVNVEESTPFNSQEFDALNLTVDQWFASRATFLYEYDNVVQTKGYYLDDSGKLSNQEIRIQDNYYYQAFSYVMSTARDISEYSTVLNITHPAGTKRFSNLTKTNDYKFSFVSSRTISLDAAYYTDIATVSETISLHLVKGLSETLSTSETFTQPTIN